MVYYGNQAELRQKRRELEGSGAKNFKNPTISASGYWQIGLETDSLLAKYLPVDFVQVTNGSSADIEITKNGSRNQVIKAGTVVAIEGEPIFSLRAKDLGGSGITAETLEIVAEKKRLDADTLAYRQAQETPIQKLAKAIPLIGLLR